MKWSLELALDPCLSLLSVTCISLAHGIHHSGCRCTASIRVGLCNGGLCALFPQSCRQLEMPFLTCWWLRRSWLSRAWLCSSGMLFMLIFLTDNSKLRWRERETIFQTIAFFQSSQAKCFLSGFHFGLYVHSVRKALQKLLYSHFKK